MRDAFVERVKTLEQEILSLKQGALKSGQAIGVRRRPVSLSIPLHLNESKTSAGGGATIAVRSSAEKPFLFFATANWYYEDIFDVWSRTLDLEEYKGQGGDYRVDIGITGSYDDTNTLISGGSVTVEATITVTATVDFALEVL